MVTVRPALTASATLGVFPTLASFAALTMLVTLAMLATLVSALLLLHALSSSRCLTSSPLVLECPRSRSLHPPCWVCSMMGVLSGSACGGVLDCLHCSPSSREDCHLDTVWSKCHWHWWSKSLTVANGSGIGATICIRILFAILACLAWSSISRRSSSLS